VTDRKKKVNEVLNDAKALIRNQLNNSVKKTKDLTDQSMRKIDQEKQRLHKKICETASDSSVFLKDNADNVAILLAVMLIL